MRSALQKSGAFASKSMMGKPSPSSIGSVRGMAKEIKFGVEGRSAMLKGVDTLADAVQVRLNYDIFLCLLFNNCLRMGRLVGGLVTCKVCWNFLFEGKK